jgi:hypothetical protein
MMSLSSHTGDGIVKSCWQWRCQGDVSHGVMSLPSHVSDGVAVAEAALAMTLPVTMLT